jgi:hypothetical protein
MKFAIFVAITGNYPDFQIPIMRSKIFLAAVIAVVVLRRNVTKPAPPMRGYKLQVPGFVFPETCNLQPVT